MVIVQLFNSSVRTELFFSASSSTLSHSRSPRPEVIMFALKASISMDFNFLNNISFFGSEGLYLTLSSNITEKWLERRSS